VNFAKARYIYKHY